MQQRIGIDVGGTNTDAVLMQGQEVIGWVKTPTTADVTSGIVTALQELLQQTTAVPSAIRGVMICRITPRVRSTARRWWEEGRRMRSAYTTCAKTFTSGAATGMTRITTPFRPIAIRRDRRPARAAPHAADHGAIRSKSAAAPRARVSHLIYNTRTTGFASFTRAHQRSACGNRPRLDRRTDDRRRDRTSR